MTTEPKAKTRTPRAKSKNARIRKLVVQGKLTPKQVAEKVGVPVSYVYVVRSKLKAELGGLPAVATRSRMPVPGGIQEVATQAEAMRPAPTPQPQIAVRVEQASQFKHVHTPSPAMRPAHVVIERPPMWERIKERIRVWLA